jgi:hypothetical protein
VVIYYFDVEGIPFVPPKTDSPLIINANAVAPFTASRQLLKPITRRKPQVAKGLSRV